MWGCDTSATINRCTGGVTRRHEILPQSKEYSCTDKIHILKRIFLKTVLKSKSNKTMIHGFTLRLPPVDVNVPLVSLATAFKHTSKKYFCIYLSTCQVCCRAILWKCPHPYFNGGFNWAKPVGSTCTNWHYANYFFFFLVDLHWFRADGASPLTLIGAYIHSMSVLVMPLAECGPHWPV